MIFHGFSPSYGWKDQIAFGKKIDADRHLFAHKVHDEKPTMVRLDVQTSCLRGINMVFVINKHGVYEE